MLKSGWKTSEFWVTTLTAIATILNQSGILGSFTLPIEAIGTISAVIGAYVISRGLAKK